MNIGQAVQLSKGLAKQYRAVLALAEVMEGVADLETARDKALHSAKEASDELEKIKYEFTQKEANLKRIKNEIRSIESTHAKTSEEASKKLSMMLAEASHEAKDIVKEAKKEASLISLNVKNDFEVHMEEMKELDDKIQEKEEHLSKIKKSLARIDASWKSGA